MNPGHDPEKWMPVFGKDHALMEVRLSGLGRLFLFGLYGAGGAVAGALCGIAIGDAAAQAFGEPIQLYHFALVLGFIGAGIAIGMIIAPVSLERAVLEP